MIGDVTLFKTIEQKSEKLARNASQIYSMTAVQYRLLKYLNDNPHLDVEQLELSRLLGTTRDSIKKALVALVYDWGFLETSEDVRGVIRVKLQYEVTPAGKIRLEEIQQILDYTGKAYPELALYSKEYDEILERYKEMLLKYDEVLTDVLDELKIK